MWWVEWDEGKGGLTVCADEAVCKKAKRKREVGNNFMVLRIERCRYEFYVIDGSWCDLCQYFE